MWFLTKLTDYSKWGKSLSTVGFQHMLSVFRFAAQLTEILHALPPSRQTLLFSATLPKSLVEFARAGLQEPRLVRLDADSKISQDLQSAFFTTKSEEKEGALLHILSDVIQIPLGQTEAAGREKEDAGRISKKRKRGDADGAKPRDSPTEHSTIIFCSTKHVRNLLGSIIFWFDLLWSPRTYLRSLRYLDLSFLLLQ